MASQKAGMGRVKDVITEVVVHKLLRVFFKSLFATVGWQPILIILIFTIILAPVMGASGAVYNFLSNSQVDTISDEKLKSLYDEVSVSSVDSNIVADDPGMAMYQVPWYVFAAIDKVQNNCEEPQPLEYVDPLRPIVKTRDSIIKTVTTVDDSDSYKASVTEVLAPIVLVDTVDTFKGIYRHNYISSTTTTVSTQTVSRSYTKEDLTEEYYTATITTTVSITKDILSDIQEPTPPDYTRFITALESFGITYKSDQDLVYVIAQKYSGHDVDLSQPVNFLMGFEGTGGIPMVTGAAPPASWLPWFRVAAEKYHGNTPVAQFEALLIAIAFTESSFSESRSKVSTANAKGPFQFTDDTWSDYGIKKLGYSVEDVWIASKAVMATALMEAQAGADRGDLGGIKAALWRYNQSIEYGNLVMGRMVFYGTITGWVPDVNSGLLVAGSPSTKGFYWPVPSCSSISSPFGPRINPYTFKAGYHTGIDIPGALMAPIIAPKDGIVASLETGNKVYGYKLTIGHGGGVETMYGHLQNVAPGIVEGAQVKAGQVIAYVGNRGNSTGPHLHIEVLYNLKPVNPLVFFNQPK